MNIERFFNRLKYAFYTVESFEARAERRVSYRDWYFNRNRKQFIKHHRIQKHAFVGSRADYCYFDYSFSV
mgnify:CR=1 FL=1